MLYDYCCKNCGHEIIDYYQSIHDKPITDCPQCNNPSLERVIYGGVAHFVKDVKTVGQMADKNWNSLGSYKRSEITEQAKKDQASEKKATRKEILKMSEKQREKYIITGEK